MPISEADFFGGSVFISSMKAIDYIHPDRGYFYRNDQAILGSKHLRLPDTTKGKHWVAWEGRPMFQIYNGGGASGIVVKRSDATVLGTITTNKIGTVRLIDAITETWELTTTTKWIPRTLQIVSALAAIPNPSVIKTENPFCFEGSLCELLKARGNRPLDGTDCNTAILTVSEVVEQKDKFKATIDATHQNGYWTGGLVTWTSGPNNATSQRILSYDNSDNTIILEVDPANNISISETATLTPPCNDIVVVPMYEDPNEITNSEREAIRAADVLMPSHIALQLTRDCFTVDTNHPWNGLYTLSSDFYDALYGGSEITNSGEGSDRPWILPYDLAKAGSDETSHFHQIHRGGASVGSKNWRHGDVAVVMNAFKYMWRQIKKYGPAHDPELFTMEVRFIVEHANSAEGVVIPPGGGDGETDLWGAWGLVASLYIFTDELNPTWVENSTTFTPVGFIAAHTFDRDDPAVSALAHNLEGTETGTTDAKAARKGVHPQCVAMASIPLSWHDPIGKNFVPLEDLRYFKKYQLSFTSGNARNMDESYKVRNGAPWIDFVGCTTPAPIRYPTPDDVTGMLRNVIFGWPAPSSYVGRPITLGGSLPVSKPMEWLVWENGEGIGRTWLKPTKPGWDEKCGVLDLSNGNCGSITFCIDNGDSSVDSEEIWPVFKTQPCEGHPDEPFEAVGGSHKCWRNKAGALDPTTNGANAVDPFCCIVTNSPSAMRFYEVCIIQWTQYGDVGSVSCDVENVGCNSTRTAWTQFYTFPDDYYFAPNTSQLARTMNWRRILGDPDHPIRDLTDFNSTGVADIGTWTLGAATAVTTGLAGPTAVTWMVHHQDTGDGIWDWWGCRITATGDNTLSNNVGVGFMDEENTNDATGWGIVTEVVDADSVLVKLVFYHIGVETTVIDSLQLDVVSTDGVFVYEQIGTEIRSASYTPTTGPAVDFIARNGGLSIHVWDSVLDADDMFPVIFSTDANSGASLSAITIEDLVEDLETVCELDWSNNENLSGYGDERHFILWGVCEDLDPTNCGTCCSPAKCNCRTVDEERWRNDGPFTHNPATWADIDSKQTKDGCEMLDIPCDPDSPWDGDNPTYHGGPSPGRCQCRGNDCVTGFSCDSCLGGVPGEALAMMAPMPVDKVMWKANDETKNQNPDCFADIPLVCRGLDGWEYVVIVCI